MRAAPNSRDGESEPLGTPPVVTLVVLSYNQETYISEAVRSALSQTYGALEIIISDDASTDRSQAVIRSIISGYSGRHSLSFICNPHNLGIGAHVNAVFKRAKGELVILAGGDDISHPDRASHVVEAWLETGMRAHSVYCGATLIDRHGNTLGPAASEIELGPRNTEHLILFKHPTQSLAIGACGAYSKEVMRRFGDLDKDLPIEDIPLLIRASMLGEIKYVHKPLVRYRTESSVWRKRKPERDSFSLRQSRRRFYTGARLSVARQVLKDAILTGSHALIEAASKGYLLHAYVDRSAQRQSMEWTSWLGVALCTGNWRYSLAASLMDGHPNVHRFLFACKNLFFAPLLRLFRRESGRL